jgi:subtilisin family serine protease
MRRDGSHRHGAGAAMIQKLLAWTVVGWIGLASSWAETAPPQYILRVKQDSALGRVCVTHGLEVVRSIGWLSLYVVRGPAAAPAESLLATVRADKDVRTFEPDYVATNGQMAGAHHPDIEQTTDSLEEALAVDRTARDFYGALAWNGYVQQPALAVLEVEEARAAGQDGEGVIVAVIDSGIDPDNPVLKDVLLPGYDFTRNQPGASEWGDLVQSTAAILDSQKCDTFDPSADGTVTQSTAAILDSRCVPGILNQSTAAILDDESTRLLAEEPPIPATFGHGTMVAGLIHSVAPRARILPLKAFAADGTGRSSDIAQAIYYAVASGARVLNLSFTFENLSQEVMYATADAALQGTIVVAAAGNDGLAVQRWPAEHKWVVGVGATTLWDARAPFSNQGYSTFKIGAPGVNLVTTYPGGAYAAVSGTSFSAPLVSGALALMGTAAPLLDWGATSDVLNKGRFVEISDVVRNADHRYPQRLLLPSAVALASKFERDSVKKINISSEWAPTAAGPPPPKDPKAGGASPDPLGPPEPRGGGPGSAGSGVAVKPGSGGR